MYVHDNHSQNKAMPINIGKQKRFHEPVCITLNFHIHDNQLSELYWNDKALSADIPEGEDKKTLDVVDIFIQTNAY